MQIRWKYPASVAYTNFIRNFLASKQSCANRVPGWSCARGNEEASLFPLAAPCQHPDHEQGSSGTLSERTPSPEHTDASYDYDTLGSPSRPFAGMYVCAYV